MGFNRESEAWPREKTKRSRILQGELVGRREPHARRAYLSLWELEESCISPKSGDGEECDRFTCPCMPPRAQLFFFALRVLNVSGGTEKYVAREIIPAVLFLLSSFRVKGSLLSTALELKDLLDRRRAHVTGPPSRRPKRKFA